jgi:hypothetical protein
VQTAARREDLGLFQNNADTPNEPTAISIAPKNPPALDSAANNVMERPGASNAALRGLFAQLIGGDMISSN